MGDISAVGGDRIPLILLFDLPEELMGNLDSCLFTREEKPTVAQLAVNLWHLYHSTTRCRREALGQA